MNVIYCLMLDFDHNIDSNVLTFGSLLFEFVNEDYSFNIMKFTAKVCSYINYNKESIDKMYDWLVDNGFIYYDDKYYVSDMIKDVLREPEKIYDIETSKEVKHIKTGEKDVFNM